MTQIFDLILRGGTVVTPGGEARTDIGIIGERIARIGDLSQAAAGEIYGASGLHILPGVIDTQVHFREPGLEHKADLETEARSAALGGVTAVFEMPNTNPSTVTPDLLQDKLNRAKGRMDIDHAFYAGATHDNVALLPVMERMLGCCGVKVFMGASTGDLLVHDDAGVEAVIKAIKRRAAFHSEDEYRLAERRPLARTGDWTSHPEVRDVESAVMSTKRLLRIARAAGKRIHVLHISTAEEL
ncbi:MAG: dihydroorotase, partial [Hyphomonas sp.]|nr:dihydroorotase [Hyphomonas sp.]